MATRSVSEIRGVLCENLKNMSLSQIHVLPMEDWQSAYTNDLKIVCDDYYFGLFNMAMWGSMGLVAVVYGCDFTGIIDRVFGYGLLSFYWSKVICR